jgi:Na+/proline symporter/nitrogen-specific signal transduction histidine kinase
MPAWVLVTAAIGYLLLLFAIAWWGDRQQQRASRLSRSATVYALSLAVFCTTWTFYGSVGRASAIGLGFLPIYLGPTLAMTLGFVLLRKIVLIAKTQRITSIADFIATRYGRSQFLGGLVAALAVVVIIPYISLQLKAVSVSFELLSGGAALAAGAGPRPFLLDSAFHTTLLMAAFTILFGARQIDAAEHHPGVVIAVAFESVVKLVAFLAVGGFVAYGLFGGMGELFAAARARADIAPLLTAAPVIEDGGWVTSTILAMLAIICLPRQFQLLVVENLHEGQLRRAMWLFPLYLLLINLFVLPIALAGLLLLPGAGLDRDMVVLALPLAQGFEWLALLVFIGGLSAAAGMIVVETIALSTMVSNNLMIPTLLRRRLARAGPAQGEPRLPVLAIRRSAIVAILLLGYAYFHLAGSAYALVAIGLISFTGVAQFAPALIGGIFWAGATRRGAISGLSAGTVVWGYTLLLPSFARSGWLPERFISEGPWGMELLRPYALLGMEGLDPLTHALFWSGLVNIGLFVGVSLFDRAGAAERAQATAFVEAFQPADGMPRARGEWAGAPATGELTQLLRRLLGPERAAMALAEYARDRGLRLDPASPADAELILFAERLLTGVIGAASARVALASLTQGGAIGPAELMRMLDEASQVIEYSRRLEQKSAELERASAALQAANARLRELDQMKDDFLSTVTHELRTPLTAVRSLSEILHDNPDMELDQRQEFLGLIIKESERLTRLINQLLDMAKMEAGAVQWQVARVDLGSVVEEAVASTGQLFRDRGVAVRVAAPAEVPPIQGDHDRLMQVLVNLLSNAVKFSPAGTGLVEVALTVADGAIEVRVRDNGPGLPEADLDIVFDKFRQSGGALTDKPAGTGLGLAICRHIIEHLGGRIWAENGPGGGAVFAFRLPLAPRAQETVPLRAAG